MSLYLDSEYVVVNCGSESSGGCGMDFAMPRWFYDETKRTGKGWSCPRGHGRRWSGPTTEQKLKSAEARSQHLSDQLQAAVREAEDVRQALIRDRQRFANGVCPCCNRSFTNVRRHMKTKHPDFDVTKVEQGAPKQFRCTCGSKFDSFQGLRIHQGHNRREGWDKPDASPWRAHLTKIAN